MNTEFQYWKLLVSDRTTIDAPQAKFEFDTPGLKD